jgi:hypothetical protein
VDEQTKRHDRSIQCVSTKQPKDDDWNNVLMGFMLSKPLHYRQLYLDIPVDAKKKFKTQK